MPWGRPHRDYCPDRKVIGSRPHPPNGEVMPHLGLSRGGGGLGLAHDEEVNLRLMGTPTVRVGSAASTSVATAEGVEYLQVTSMEYVVEFASVLRLSPGGLRTAGPHHWAVWHKGTVEVPSKQQQVARRKPADALHEAVPEVTPGLGHLLIAMMERMLIACYHINCLRMSGRQPQPDVQKSAREVFLVPEKACSTESAVD